MSYRTVKRVLGETSLEWKCRVLFGACLLLLISAAFWYASTVAEDLVLSRTQLIGRDHVDKIMLKVHMLSEHWVGDNQEDRDKKDMVNETIENLLDEEFDWTVLGYTEVREVQQPADAAEESIMARLELAMEQQLAQQEAGLADEQALAGETDEIDPHPAQEEPPRLAPVFEAVQRKIDGEMHYVYYQPIYWNNNSSCLSQCHKAMDPTDYAVAAHDRPLLGDETPLRVMKVEIPLKETRDAITKTRAVLAATAIVTVFMAMIALYVVVRYVVVKPLQHLRTVSEEISGGNMQVRAEIETGDEFQDLADSFNRMLRHLIDSQNQLRYLNVTLDGKVDQLAQANMKLFEMNRLKSDFLANMSHELRTPLNSIIGFSEVLQGIDTLDEKQQRYVQNIQKSGRLLLEMINDILDLAKVESGKMEVNLTEFDINHLVSAQCDLVRTMAEEKMIELQIEAEPGLPQVLQDRGKVQQILTNLLSNAIKYTPEGGRVQVSPRRAADGQLEVSVSDTGVGIAEEDREIVFEKFRQAGAIRDRDNLTRQYSGTGLGLSIVRELCKLLGGEVDFESELGVGSRFHVRLPWRGVEPTDHGESLDDSRFISQLAIPGPIQPTNPADGDEIPPAEVTS